MANRSVGYPSTENSVSHTQGYRERAFCFLPNVAAFAF